MAKSPRPGRRAALALLLASCCLLSSCLTRMLWDLQDDTGGDRCPPHARERDDADGLPIWARILLTPVTLAVDLVVCAFCDDDEPCQERPPRSHY